MFNSSLYGIKCFSCETYKTRDYVSFNVCRKNITGFYRPRGRFILMRFFTQSLLRLQGVKKSTYKPTRVYGYLKGYKIFEPTLSGSQEILGLTDSLHPTTRASGYFRGKCILELRVSAEFKDN
jgi:hypothetical protein